MSLSPCVKRKRRRGLECLAGLTSGCCCRLVVLSSSVACPAAEGSVGGPALLLRLLLLLLLLLIIQGRYKTCQQRRCRQDVQVRGVRTEGVWSRSQRV